LITAAAMRSGGSGRRPRAQGADRGLPRVSYGAPAAPSTP